MSDVQGRYFVMHSHDIKEGPSGPARSYWDIKYGDPDGSYSSVGYSMLCTPLTDETKRDWMPNNYAYGLNEAVKRGRSLMQDDFKRLMGIKQ